MSKVTIEIQHFEGCPNSPVLLERVRKAIKDFEDIDFKEVLVETNEQAEEIGFRGSPTLLINGIDIDGLAEPDKPALMCRYYPNGIPDIKLIKQKIRNELNRGD